MIDLFSGIGGFHLAAEWVWGDELEVVCHCDIETFPQKILKKHWPEVLIIPDIHDLKGNEFGPIDLICGGFPCQPFSVAGKQESKEDDRYLWPEMLRVIKEARPSWVVGENVTGIISLALDEVLSSLEDAGYAFQAFIIPACAKDAPHRRDRVWIVAHSGGTGREEFNATAVSVEPGYGARGCDAVDVADTARELFNRSGKPGKNRRDESANGGENVSDAKGEQNGGLFEQEVSANTGTSSYGAGEASTWPAEPGVGRVAHGIPNRVERLKGLGNAIVPQVAA